MGIKLRLRCVSIFTLGGYLGLHCDRLCLFFDKSKRAMICCDKISTLRSLKKKFEESLKKVTDLPILDQTSHSAHWAIPS